MASRKRRSPEDLLNDQRDKRIDKVYRLASAARQLKPINVISVKDDEPSIPGLFRAMKQIMVRDPAVTDETLVEAVFQYVGTADGVYPKHHVVDVATELKREDSAT